MGDALVDQNQLEQIGTYVKNNLGQWLRDQNIISFPDRGLDKELLERMVTIEQQLKYQNEKFDMMLELSDKRFQAVDKRFEDQQKYMDKRFESVDKRFNMLTWFIGIGFVLITTLMSVYNFIG
ncbi:MAG: hypothetical protein B6241_13240 [Spirochaetaceae bacterium 4572_59]|nr:MAG: hypothetical protein B6241_13240 [Spirochaetaceae bacterium 4572_59]